MKYCSNCGKEILEEGTVFCSTCGAKINGENSTLSKREVNKVELLGDGKEYIKLQFKKISFNKDKLKMIKTFVQENLLIIFFLNFVAYLLLTVLPAKIGWIYIIGFIFWIYLYPLLTSNSEIKLNKKIENDLMNSDVIVKDYLKKQKIAQIRREEEQNEERERQQIIQIDKELAMQAKQVAEQEEELVSGNKKIENQHLDELKSTNSVSNSKINSKLNLNTIILFLGMLPILIVVSVLISSDYLFVNVTGSLLLPSLIISFISSLIYYIPTFISRGTSKTTIFVINLFFGWSIIGWIVCLVWAMNDNSKYDLIQVIQQNNK